MKKTIKKLMVLAGVLLITGFAYGQKEVQASPADSVSGVINNAHIHIRYSSPSVKGRTIWGDLEPFGNIWRAGANQATTFETDKDIMVEGERLPAGKYAFFLIPEENDEWIAIFNTNFSQWGAFNYDESKDQLRVKVKTKTNEKSQERLSYKINADNIELQWDKVSVPISIQ